MGDLVSKRINVRDFLEKTLMGENGQLKKENYADFLARDKFGLRL